ncbi:MAG: protein kinase [Pseudomonadota bacterium]
MNHDNLVGDRYRIIRDISSGAFGVIYKAVQLSTNQTVAIKLLHSNPASPALPRNRFDREVKASAIVSHPHLVQLLDAGVTESGAYYLVYEFVEGMSLEAFVRGAGGKNRLSVLRLMREVLEALVSIHQKGVVHGDLKPSNIMIATEGVVPYAKVIDFGLASFIDDAMGTEAAEVFGTPEYSAPEQLKGLKIDRTTDLYSWAMILLECLTARSMFEGRSPGQILTRQLDETSHQIPAFLAPYPIYRGLRSALEKRQFMRSYRPAVLLEQIDQTILMLQQDEVQCQLPCFIIAIQAHTNQNPTEVATLIAAQISLFGASVISAAGNQYLLRFDSSFERSHEATTLVSLLTCLSSSLQCSLGVSYLPSSLAPITLRQLATTAESVTAIQLASHQGGSGIAISRFAALAAGRDDWLNAEKADGGAAYCLIDPETPRPLTTGSPLIIRETALSQLAVLIEQEKPVCLLGEPGSGKSYLARILTGTSDAAWDTIDCRSFGISDQENLLHRVRGHPHTHLLLENLEGQHHLLIEWLNNLRDPNSRILITSSDHHIAGSLGKVTRFTLDPLAPGEIRSLIEAWTGTQMEHDRLETIVELSGGNAWYAKELCCANTVNANTPTQSGIPTAMCRLVLDRVEESPLTEFLEFAAVLGKEFPRHHLRHPTSAEPIHPACLDELLMTFLSLSTSGESLTYRFRSPIVQEIIYAAVPVERRSAYHRQVFANLSSTTDQLPQFLAFQKWAQANLPAAAAHWYQAAQNARADSDHVGANRFFRYALNSLGEDIDSKLFEKSLSGLIDCTGAVYGYSGSEVASTLDRYAREITGAAHSFLELSYRIARHYQGKGQLEQSITISNHLLKQPDIHTDLPRRRAIMLTHAFTQTYLGMYRQALESLSSVDTTEPFQAIDFEDQGIHLSCGILECWLDFLCGRVGKAFWRIAELDAIASRLPSENVARLMKLSTHTNMLRIVGDFPAALSLCDELMTDTSSGRAPFWYAIALMQKGNMLVRLDGEGPGASMVLEGLGRFQDINALHGVTEWQVLTAETLLACGRIDEAEAHLDSARSYIEITGETMFCAPIALTHGYLAHLRKDDATALTLLDQAIKIAQDQATALFEVRARALRHRLLGASPESFEQQIRGKLDEPDFIRGITGGWQAA